MSDSSQILFIDGNQEDCDYFTQRLQICSAEFVILHANTGLSGLTLCQRQSIDCILLEIDLPDMSGFEVLLNLVPRVWRPDNAVIVLTQLANQYLLQGALKNGAQAALYKPMTSGDILYQTILKAMSIVPKDKKRHMA